MLLKCLCTLSAHLPVSASPVLRSVRLCHARLQTYRFQRYGHCSLCLIEPCLASIADKKMKTSELWVLLFRIM